MGDASSQSASMNIVVCGLIGSGKSSLVNMLVGEDRAKTSDSASACTSVSSPYDAALLPDGSAVKVWDTPGLGQAEDSNNTHSKAIADVYSLLQSGKDVSLLIFCHGVMQGRLNKAVVEAFKVLAGFRKRNVPIALVVTGLEGTRNRDAWWRENSAHYIAEGMNFGYHACITSRKGDMSQNETYQQSVDVIRSMVHRCLTGNANATEPAENKTSPKPKGKPAERSKGRELYDGLIGRKFSDAEAKRVVKEYERMCTKKQ